MKTQVKVEFEGNFRAFSSIVNFEFYLQEYQSLTYNVWKNTQTKLLGLSLILRNVQDISILDINYITILMIINKTNRLLIGVNLISQKQGNAHENIFKMLPKIYSKIYQYIG